MQRHWYFVIRVDTPTNSKYCSTTSQAYLRGAVLPRLDVLRELAVCPAGVAKVNNLAAHAHEAGLQLIRLHALQAHEGTRG
jgi:hypothetical protein